MLVEVRTLAERGADQTELRLQHGRHPLVGSLPVGRFLELYEDRAGGWFSAAPLKASYVEQLVLPAVRSSLMFTSFGFLPSETPHSETWTRRDGLPYRTLRAIDLYEVSVVQRPAYPREHTKVRWYTDDLPPAQWPVRSVHIDAEVRHREQVMRTVRADMRLQDRRRVRREIRSYQRKQTIENIRRGGNRTR